MARADSVDVDAILDSVSFRGLPLLVCAYTFSIMVLDGFDIQVIGFAAPALVAELGVERSTLAPALAASLIGMMIGAFAAGWVGDRWGRRPALLLSTLLFGTTTVLAATATTVNSIAAWRFLTGIGLGGALPSAVALMAEFSSPRKRSLAIIASLIGVPLGGTVGSALAVQIMPAFGWRGIFIAGGVLPLIAAAAMFLVLPESPRFLATRTGRSTELARVLNRLEGNTRYSAESRFVLSRPTVDRGMRAIFGTELLRDTVLTALLFLTNMFAVYAFFNWAPLVLTAMGFEQGDAVRGALVFNLAGMAGSLLNAWAVARIGSRTPLAACACVGILAVAALAWLAFNRVESQGGPSLQSFLMSIAIAGFAIQALQAGAYILAAHVFPTQCRASGLGFASGVGRLGGALSSFAGAALLSVAGPEGFFGGTALVLVLALACVLALHRHIGHSQETALPGESTR